MSKTSIIEPGTRFAKLLVICKANKNDRGEAHSWCLCDCGKLKVIKNYNLKIHKITSCRCSMNKTHGHSKSKTYKSYQSMKLRCYDITNISYKYYGARGIIVCDRWLESFENFLHDMGERPEGTSLDKINNDGNYEPSNCRWATIQEQNSNKSNNKHLTYNNETLSYVEWAKRVNGSKEIINKRLKAGWSIEKIVTTPCRSRGLPETM